MTSVYNQDYSAASYMSTWCSIL